jgi:hypothetical protein
MLLFRMYRIENKYNNIFFEDVYIYLLKEKGFSKEVNMCYFYGQKNI